MTALSVCIVGGGLAGSTVAHELQAAEPDVRVVVIDDDPDGPYDRPPLTKRLFDPGFDPSGRPAWAAQGCEWVRDRVVAIEPRKRVVTLASGRAIPADVVVLATGGRPRTQSQEMWDFACIRTAADARWLRRQVDALAAPRVLIEGAGPLGCEMASTLAKRGASVVVVEADRLPMRRLLGPDLGADVAAWAVAAGLDLRLERHIRSVERTATGVFEIEISDGQVVEADVAISAIGMTPACELTAGHAAADTRGVHCDSRGRVLDANGVAYAGFYAVGDVAAVTDPVTGALQHLESWTNAVEQGAAVAADILGSTPPPLNRPYFWTEAFGRRIQVLGRVPVDRPSAKLLADYPERHGAVYRFDQDGKPAAWVAINAPRDFAKIMRDEQAQQALT